MFADRGQAKLIHEMRLHHPETAELFVSYLMRQNTGEPIVIIISGHMMVRTRGTTDSLTTPLLFLKKEFEIFSCERNRCHITVWDSASLSCEGDLAITSSAIAYQHKQCLGSA